MSALAWRHRNEDESCRAVPVAGEEIVCDRSGLAYWPDEKLLLVADLHLEKGSSFARRGLMLPPYDTGITLAALSAGIAAWQPRRVIALGDSFHDRAASNRLPEIYREALAGAMRGRDWIWVTGNHDPDAPSGLAGESASEVRIRAITMCHEPGSGRRTGEIAGHLHPQARIAGRGSTVRRACFACDGERMILPAFGAFTGGLNLRDPAFGGLFCPQRLEAHILGRTRIYTVAGTRLS